MRAWARLPLRQIPMRVNQSRASDSVGARCRRSQSEGKLRVARSRRCVPACCLRQRRKDSLPQCLALPGAVECDSPEIAGRSTGDVGRASPTVVQPAQNVNETRTSRLRSAPVDRSRPSYSGASLTTSWLRSLRSVRVSRMSRPAVAPGVKRFERNQPALCGLLWCEGLSASSSTASAAVLAPSFAAAQSRSSSARRR